MNAATYLIILQQAVREFLQSVPTAAQRETGVLHDDAPAHFTLQLRIQQGLTYPRRWFGPVGPAAWPPRSVTSKLAWDFRDYHPLNVVCAILCSIVSVHPLDAIYHPSEFVGRILEHHVFNL
ncbi:hypothetical protein NPIL_171501 [Nephila pilipes]|uniref:Uncharacterized protein n=1 Tax=Nephila pilipes TaxID=299642 RepID=A0A8X6N8X8_NEPPI|nr:hypothetical protein NPIL_171501 [Nephila pilipes]